MDQIQRLLAVCVPKVDIIRRKTQEWGISEKRVQRLFKMAVEMITAQYTEDREEMRALEVFRLDHLYGLALKAEQYSTCVRISAERSELLALKDNVLDVNVHHEHADLAMMGHSDTYDMIEHMKRFKDHVPVLKAAIIDIPSDDDGT